MELIIKINDEVYKTVLDGSYCGSLYEELLAAIPYNPSGDLIDRETLKNHARKVICGDNPTNSLIIRMFDEIIDNAPASEITEEQAINKLHETGWLIGHDKEMTTRPQGEWINHRNDYGHNIADCSLCGKTMQWHDEDSDGIPRYCWYCGASMKGGEQKNDDKV